MQHVEGREKCPSCSRCSYSFASFGWCPWCDKAAPDPSPRRTVLIDGNEFRLEH